MSNDRFTPAFGDLNDVDEPKISKSLNIESPSFLSSIKDAILDTYRKDAFQNISSLKGIVLRIDNNPNTPEPNSWISRIYNFEKTQSLKHLKVRIPEIHAALPDPEKYGNNAGDSNKVIDMYPTFIALNEEISNKPVAPGDIVLVDFGNRINLTQPIYLGPVFSQPTPGAVGQKSSKDIFSDNTSKNNNLSAMPPTGSADMPILIEKNNEPLMTVNNIPDDVVASADINNDFPSLTEEKLRKIMPRATKDNIQKYLEPLNKAMKLYEINTPLRQAAFLSQIAVESGQLKYDTELPSKYNGYDFSLYDNRKSLGNNQPGDGAKFKGRGLLQLTGRANYTAMTLKLSNMGITVDLVNQPDLAGSPEYSAIIAGQYFKDKNINFFADKQDIEKVTRLVNGGINNLKERTDFYDKATEILA